MNPVSAICDGYLRWRHSKGYGVHSPFAYKIVTEVISPGKYGYYGYHEIDRIAAKRKSGYLSGRDLKLLLRLSIALHSKEIVGTSDESQELRKVAKCAGASFREVKEGKIFSATPGLLVITPAITSPKIVSNAINHGYALIAFDPSEKVKDEILKPLIHGVLFHGTRIFVLIPREEMEYVDYTIKFP